MHWLNSWRTKGEPRYDLSVVLALGLVMWILAGPEQSAARAYYAVVDLLAAGLVVASALSDGQRRRRRLMPTIAGLLCLSAVVSLVASASAVRATTAIALLAVSVYVPLVIARGFRIRRSLDVQRVMAAVTIYVLLGLVAASLLSIASLVQGTPLFHLSDTADTATVAADGSFQDRVYFSFVTLSTVGYGDVSPASGTARAIAMLTALVGQLYLVVAVATVVTTVASSARRGRDEDDATST